MTCPRCQAAMQAQRHLCHKQRKWCCPRCGKVRFERLAGRHRDKARSERRLSE